MIHSNSINLNIIIMKKIIILSLFLSNYVFAQSVTIAPTTNSETEILKIKKLGKGLEHRNPNGNVGLITYVTDSEARIETLSSHSLFFGTFNSFAKMIIAANGYVGIGTYSPSQKLHVDGNGYFSGDLVTKETLSADGLSIGGGTTINKIFKTVLTDQTFSVLGSNLCINKEFTVAGVNIGDNVILNLNLSTSSVAISNVWASATDKVTIRYCNISNSIQFAVDDLTMIFTVIK